MVVMSAGFFQFDFLNIGITIIKHSKVNKIETYL